MLVSLRRSKKSSQSWPEKGRREIEPKSRLISVYPRAFFVEVFEVRLDVHIFTSNLLH